MDTIWDRKSFKGEVIGRCGGDEKKLNAKNNMQYRYNILPL